MQRRLAIAGDGDGVDLPAGRERVRHGADDIRRVGPITAGRWLRPGEAAVRALEVAGLPSCRREVDAERSPETAGCHRPVHDACLQIHFFRPPLAVRLSNCRTEENLPHFPVLQRARD